MDHTTSDARPDPDAEHGAVGLGPGMRYKCEGCGNLTRFDITSTERSTRFWHVALSGEGHVEQTTVTDRTIESVVCHWCGTGDRVTTEVAPAAASGG